MSLSVRPAPTGLDVCLSVRVCGVETGASARCPGAPSFRAPDASWWARTMVASMRAFSPSRSRDSASIIDAITPAADQRDQRV